MHGMKALRLLTAAILLSGLSLATLAQAPAKLPSADQAGIDATLNAAESAFAALKRDAPSLQPVPKLKPVFG